MISHRLTSPVNVSSVQAFSRQGKEEGRKQRNQLRYLQPGQKGGKKAEEPLTISADKAKQRGESREISYYNICFMYH